MRLVWQAAEKLGYKVNAKAQSCVSERTAPSLCCCRGSNIPIGPPCRRSFKASFHKRDTRSNSIPPLHGKPGTVHAGRGLEYPFQCDHHQYLSARCSFTLPDRGTGSAAGLSAARRSEQPDVMYAGFDPERAGQEIAAYIHSQGAARIGVFTESAKLPDASLFVRGIRSGSRTWGKFGFWTAGTIRSVCRLLVFSTAVKDMTISYVQIAAGRMQSEQPAPTPASFRCPALSHWPQRPL